MRPPVDVGDQEAVGQVDRQQHEDRRVVATEPPVDDEVGAEQPEDRAGRAQRGLVRGGEGVGEGAAPERGHDVQHGEPQPAEGRLELRAEQVEGVHVQQQVDDAAVQEGGREQPVVLAGRHPDDRVAERGRRHRADVVEPPGELVGDLLEHVGDDVEPR